LCKIQGRHLAEIARTVRQVDQRLYAQVSSSKHFNQWPTMNVSRKSRVLRSLLSVGRSILLCLATAISLLVWNNAIPWMIAAWLLAFTLLVPFRRGELVCLSVCLIILVAKRLTPAPGLLVLLGVMFAVIAVRLWIRFKKSTETSQQHAWVSVLALWVAWVGMTYDWYAFSHCRHPVTLHPDRPVVCIGDSMTSLGKFGGYPDDLQKLIARPVVNLGIGGTSAKQAVEEHLPYLLQHNPQVVVIEFGAHDFLRGHSRASTKAYLETLIDKVRANGAEVVLMEIPRAYLSDPYWGLEREIARQQDVELIPDSAMRMLFLRSPTYPPGTWLGEPYLTDDTGIHANARGQLVLAAAVAKALERMYGPGILCGPADGN
jgi:acyl-CoA thioesterase I